MSVRNRVPVTSAAHAAEVAARATQRMFSIPAERRPVRCDRETFHGLAYECARFGTLANRA